VRKRHHSWIIAVLAAAALCGHASAAARYGLAELRAAARAEHPTLESARAAIEAARATVRQRRTFADPVANFESGHAEDGAESGREWSAGLAQRIPLPGLRRERIRSAEAAVERARLDRRALESLLDFEVGRLWADAVLAERAAEVGARGEAIAERLLELVERRVAAGEAAPLEAIRARTEWFAGRRLSRELERQRGAARASLDVVCNRSLGRDFALADELDSARELPSIDVLLARLDGSSPEIRSARAAIAEAEAELAAERKAALPELELSLGRESELDKEATAAGFAFTVPLWNRNRAGAAVADARLQAVRAELAARRLELGLELEDAVLAHRAAGEQLALYQAGWRQSAERAFEIAGFSYRNGESSLLELLDAQRSLLEVGLAEVETRARLTVARLRIERLLGQPLDEVTTDDAL